MKLKYILFFLLFGLPALTISAQVNENIREIKFTTIDNYLLDMKYYEGEKIVIATVDASNINSTFLLSLDTLIHTWIGKIGVIVVPISDYGEPISSSSLVSVIRDSLKISYPLTAISRGNKGIGQHELL